MKEYKYIFQNKNRLPIVQIERSFGLKINFKRKIDIFFINGNNGDQKIFFWKFKKYMTGKYFFFCSKIWYYHFLTHTRTWTKLKIFKKKDLVSFLPPCQAKQQTQKMYTYRRVK